MNDPKHDASGGAARPDPVVLDEQSGVTLHELGRACRVDRLEIESWVAEGVLSPSGASRDEWRFTGTSITRLRVARRLQHDLDVNPPGVALALELMDEIASLRARLARR